jgi:hypothetical protein
MLVIPHQAGQAHEALPPGAVMQGEQPQHKQPDVVLVGTGIMSATLGVLLAVNSGNLGYSLASTDTNSLFHLRTQFESLYAHHFAMRHSNDNSLSAALAEIETTTTERKD